MAMPQTASTSRALTPEHTPASVTATRVQDLEQHVRQLQQEANNAGALEYRCEGLQQEKHRLTMQLQQLRSSIVQMQSSLHQERLQRQQQEEAAQKAESARKEIQDQCLTLQARLKVAEQRAAEAEEEQVNSEQHLTGQIAELAALHHEQDTFTSSADQLLPSQLNTAATSSAAQQAQHAQQELQGLQSALNTSNASLASTQQQLSLARQQIRQLQHSDAEDATGTPQPQHVQHSITAEQQSLLQRVQGQVASLKGSRDKLLQEVDRQSLEIARLVTENAALEQGVESVQKNAAAWQEQAQDNLQQVHQLKSLLEESAFWGTDGSGPDQDPEKHQQPTPLLQGKELQQQMLEEKARATSLDVQVKALCFELAHVREAAGKLPF